MGQISNIKIKAVNGIYYIEAEEMTNTADMDVKLKSRLFQNQNMSYKDLISKVTDDYQGSRYESWKT